MPAAAKARKREASKAKGYAAKGEDQERDVPQAEKDVVGKILAEIDRAKTIRKKFDETTLPKLRRYTWGTASTSSQAETSTRTNLIFATIATLLPHIYAKNPEIAVAPTEAVGKDEYKKIKDFCKTAQVMLNNLFVEEAKLKRRQKSNARSAMTTSVGWLKMSFQKSITTDPLVQRRANDVQDNLRRVEYLISCIDKETDPTKLNQERAELQEQLTAIMDSPESKLFKGFVLDRVKTEDMFILDESIVEFDDYVHAKRLAHRIWMRDEEYYETFGHDVPKGASQYGQPAPGDLSDDTGTKIDMGPGGGNVHYRAVYEVWDRTSNSICCVCEGCAGYARHPYVLKPASERWYSFFALGFNVVEGRWRPIADVELLERLQDEYNTTRFLFAETRKESIPTRVFRKAGNLTEEDIKALTDRKARDWVGIEGNPNNPLTNDIMQLEGIKIDPAAFDVTVIRNDMDMLVGLSDASRANLIQAKTATEAEIMRQSLMTRVAERQDSIEDLTSEMATAALEIMMQEFSVEEVKQIVGEGAVWPKLAIDEIFRKVRVSVRAGSTGKPNILKERESWASIMPLINDTITQVMELRAAGQFDLAQSKIEILKETLTRYDEKIDVDRFIPEQETGADGKPTAQQNAIQQNTQLTQQNQALTEELTKTKDALTKAQAGEQSKIAQIEADKVIATAQQGAKQAEATAKATEAQAQAAKDEAVEKERVAAEQRTELEKANIQATTQRYTAMVGVAGKIVEAVMKPQPTPGAPGEGGEAQAQQPKPVDPAEMMKKFDETMAALTEVLKALGADAIPSYDAEGRITKVSRQAAAPA